MSQNNPQVRNLETIDLNEWIIRDQRTGKMHRTVGHPNDNIIIEFKNKLGYSSVEIIVDDPNTRTMEFRPIDMSA